MQIELNYYWGDDSFHSGERLRNVVNPPNIPALVVQHKPSKASVAFCLVYINDVYSSTVEVL